MILILKTIEESNSGESLDSINANSTKSLNPDNRRNQLKKKHLQNSPIKVDADGVIVEVEFNESIFFVNVNGVQFWNLWLMEQRLF